LIFGTLCGIFVLEIALEGCKMIWLPAYYSSGRDAPYILIALLGAAISIAILVWILLQINRQTKGIEEIYKLLYRMQSDNPPTDHPAEPPVQPYLKELADRDKRNAPRSKPVTTVEKICIGIGSLFVAVVILVVIIMVATNK
jgi:hypothetical protein